MVGCASRVNLMSADFTQPVGEAFSNVSGLLSSTSELECQDGALFNGTALSVRARRVPGTPPCSYPQAEVAPPRTHVKPTLLPSHSSDSRESSYRCRGPMEAGSRLPAAVQIGRAHV